MPHNSNAFKTTRLTIRVPIQEARFAKQFGKDHGITVSEIIQRYLHQMRELQQYGPSASLAAIIGLVPADVDAEKEAMEHRIKK